MGSKPSLNPLLAVLREVRPGAEFWLRPGNRGCAHDVVGFSWDLWYNLPRHLQRRVVRTYWPI